jgi:hypothetical protein
MTKNDKKPAGRIKTPRLVLNIETVRDLLDKAPKEIAGGHNRRNLLSHTTGPQN